MRGKVKVWLGVFVHQSGVEGASQLQEGQEVEFDLEDSPRGPRAVNVKIVG